MHKNIVQVNELWKKLEYFEHDVYATRLGIAYRMLSEKKSSDEVFNQNFHSAEGWYSSVAFKSGLKVKIVGVGFDDFFREPVVWMQGKLSRCPSNANLTSCIDKLSAQLPNITVHDLDPPVVSFKPFCNRSLL